ncbi:MAG: hypothetical protein AB4041_11025 [Microcystaceae cyanobacterium]
MSNTLPKTVRNSSETKENFDTFPNGISNVSDTLSKTVRNSSETKESFDTFPNGISNKSITLANTALEMENDINGQEDEISTPKIEKSSTSLHWV